MIDGLTDQQKIDFAVGKYRWKLMNRVYLRCATFTNKWAKDEIYAEELAEVAKRVMAYQQALEAGENPQPVYEGVGLWYYEPKHSFWTNTHKLNDSRNGMPEDQNISCLASKDMDCLRNEFHNMQRQAQGKDSFNSHHSIRVVVDDRQLRFMLDNWPEAFADIPPVSDEQMATRPQAEQDSHAHMLAEDDSAFINWLRDRRGE